MSTNTCIIRHTHTNAYSILVPTQRTSTEAAMIVYIIKQVARSINFARRAVIGLHSIPDH